MYGIVVAITKALPIFLVVSIVLRKIELPPGQRRLYGRVHSVLEFV